MNLPPTKNVLGFSFNDISLETTISEILRHRQTQNVFMVTTPNVDHVVRAHSKNLFHIYEMADLCLCDSALLKKLSQLLTNQLNHVTTGSDLTATLLLETNAIRDWRILFIGSEKNKIDILAKHCKLESYTHHNPPMGFIENTSEVERCILIWEQTIPQLVIIAVGSPQQELIAIAAKQRQLRGVALCVGASLDFLTGKERRAPESLRHSGLEWVWRLIQNPRRLAPRYFQSGPKFLSIFLRELFKKT